MRLRTTPLGIAYARSRPKNASKPLLLFTHATGFVKEMWKPVLDHKYFANAEWIALDHTGHGGSRPLPEDGTWEDWTYEDIASVLSDLQLDGRPVVAIGHSMGACR